MPREWPSPWLGAATLLGVVLLYDVLLTRVRRADRAFPSTNPTESTWWFGYLRDLTNFAAMFGFSIGFHLLGLPGPQALLAGCSFALVAYGLDYLIARALASRSAPLLVAAIMLAFLIPAIVLREELSAALAGLIDRLF